MGYSAQVSGYFIVGDRRLRVAKTNPRAFSLAEPLDLDLAPGTEGELLVIVDGHESRRRVRVEGAYHDRQILEYTPV